MFGHSDKQDSALASVVDRNIRALLERKRCEEARQTTSERIAGVISDFAGSIKSVAFHAVLFSVWIIINLGWISFIPQFDKSFVILAMSASVEAIFLSTFVLIRQNRLGAIADKRSDLDLHISLLSEHEITQIIKLVRAMAEQMGIRESADPELNELSKDVAPERVLDRIEHHT